MRKIIFLICILFFKINISYSQEILGLNSGLDYYSNCNEINDYDIVRTDQNGNILWRLSLSSDIVFFDSTQAYYMALGYTYEKNNRIISNPTDYDYWLVPKLKNIDFNIYPNPNLGTFNIINYNNEDEIQYEIYDPCNRLVLKNQLINISNTVNINNYSKGVYFIKIFKNDEILKFQKICIN